MYEYIISICNVHEHKRVYLVKFLCGNARLWTSGLLDPDLNRGSLNLRIDANPSVLPEANGDDEVAQIRQCARPGTQRGLTVLLTHASNRCTSRGTQFQR